MVVGTADMVVMGIAVFVVGAVFVVMGTGGYSS